MYCGGKARDKDDRARGPVAVRRSSVVRGPRKPRCTLPPILDCDCPASKLCRSGTSFGAGVSLVPCDALRVRHLANHELPGRNLLAYVLELRLARLLISFPTCLRHRLSLPSLMVVTTAKSLQIPRFLES